MRYTRELTTAFPTPVVRAAQYGGLAWFDLVPAPLGAVHGFTTPGYIQYTNAAVMPDQDGNANFLTTRVLSESTDTDMYTFDGTTRNEYAIYWRETLLPRIRRWQRSTRTRSSRNRGLSGCHRAEEHLVGDRKYVR